MFTLNTSELKNEILKNTFTYKKTLKAAKGQVYCTNCNSLVYP